MTYPKGVNTAPRHHSHTEKHFIYYVLAFIGNARQFIQYIKSYLSTKILFLIISFFKNFLSFYLILFFFKKKFLLFSATGKYQKKNICTYIFFSHFPEYSNKFIKIYFIQFFSVLQIVKPYKIIFFIFFFFI